MGRNRMAYGLSFDLSCHHARHSDCILPSTYICLSSREQDSGTYLPLCPIGVSGCQFTAVAYYTSHHSIWVLWPLYKSGLFQLVQSSTLIPSVAAVAFQGFLAPLLS